MTARVVTSALLLAAIPGAVEAGGARSSASAEITLRGVVPAICSVKAGSGTIRLTGYTDHGEGVDLGVQGEGAFNVVCNTPYALGVHRQLRRIVPYHHHRDHRGRPRVEAPSGTHEITTASITPSPVPEPARSSLSALDLGIDLQVSGNGEVQTSSCLLGPLPERIEGALLPGTAPCGVRSALDDASRPMARVQALVIVTGSIARSPAPESPALAASGYPESGTQVADLAPFVRDPTVMSDAPTVGTPPLLPAPSPVYELEHLSLSVQAKF